MVGRSLKVVWLTWPVQDLDKFQLMTFPDANVRVRCPNSGSGEFSHIPFPNLYDAVRCQWLPSHVLPSSYMKPPSRPD